MIKSFISLFTLCMAIISSKAQVDSINTQSYLLKTDQLAESTKTYVVFLQDSLNGMKYNFEIWDRTISKNNNSKTNTLAWSRHKNTKGEHYKYEITFDDKMKPLSEKVVHKTNKAENISVEKKYFIYKNDGLFTSTDTTLHNTSSFSLDTLGNSFNWELDMEVLSSLPLAENKIFAINFYHPGSKTPPKYYRYFVEREEILDFNSGSFNCWVIKVIYSKHQSSEFWIDQTTHNILKMKEEFYGRYRFKRMVM